MKQQREKVFNDDDNGDGDELVCEKIERTVVRALFLLPFFCWFGRLLLGLSSLIFPVFLTVVVKMLTLINMGPVGNSLGLLLSDEKKEHGWCRFIFCAVF